MNATISVRTHSHTKQAAQEVFEKLGVDMSTAINMFLSQVAIKQAIPFRIDSRVTVNGYTPEFELQLLREAKESLKSGKSYHSFDDMMDDVLSEVDGQSNYEVSTKDNVAIQKGDKKARKIG